LVFISSVPRPGILVSRLMMSGLLKAALTDRGQVNSFCTKATVGHISDRKQTPHSTHKLSSMTIFFVGRSTTIALTGQTGKHFAQVVHFS